MTELPSRIRALFVETERGNGLALEVFLSRTTQGLVQIETARTIQEIELRGQETWDVILLDLEYQEGLRDALAERTRLVFGSVPIVDLADGSINIPVKGAMAAADDPFDSIPVNALQFLRGLNHILEHRRLHHRVEVMQKRLTEIDRVDLLTGVWTRNYLLQRIEEAFQDWQRYHYPLTLALLDVIDLEQISDAYGFEAGESVIATFGRVIREVKRNTDFVGRLGPDRFCLLFPSTSADRALIGAERIRDAIGRTIYTGKAAENFTAGSALGMIELTEAHTALEDLLRDAREALAKAKAKGPGSIQVARPNGRS
jgi:diguanylate cyclase (GGDEF)-like protein